MYGGGPSWRPPYPPPQQQPQPPQHQPAYSRPVGAPGAPPAPAPPPAASQELTQTATIRNAVNLKKNTLEVVPLPGAPNKLAISFTFDASQPCAVTTFVVATEDPARGCRLVPAKQEAAPQIYYDKGVSCGRGGEEGRGAP